MIFHITEAKVWREAEGTGEYRAESLATEGFIHCSTAQQVIPVANRWYAGRHGLVLLAIEESRLASPLVYEDSYGAGETFPHIYGPLPTSAVAVVSAFEPEADGVFRATISTPDPQQRSTVD